MLHIHLPASTTLDRIGNEKWRKQEGKKIQGYVNMFPSWKICKTEKKKLSLHGTLMDKKRIVNAFCCRKDIFAPLKILRISLKGVKCTLFDWASNNRGFLFTAHFILALSQPNCVAEKPCALIILSLPFEDSLEALFESKTPLSFTATCRRKGKWCEFHVGVISITCCTEWDFTSFPWLCGQRAAPLPDNLQPQRPYRQVPILLLGAQTVRYGGRAQLQDSWSFIEPAVSYLFHQDMVNTLL